MQPKHDIRPIILQDAFDLDPDPPDVSFRQFVGGTGRNASGRDPAGR